MIYRYDLYRDPSEGWIAGVAAGLGARFGLGAGVVRLIFVVLAIAGTPVLAMIGYILLAVFMPVRLSRSRYDRADRWDRFSRRGY
jgi:phage shock protein PspC (stress-responsive transcriptional regulator)